MLQTHATQPSVSPGFDQHGYAHAHVSAISRVVRHLHARLDHNHTLEELAEIAGFSIWHFDRVFHRVTSMSPMAYLSASRLEAAKRLLVNSDVRIIEVCYEVGYSSLGSFGKRFTKLIGLSPRAVRAAAARFDHSALRRSFGAASAAPPPADYIEMEVASLLEEAGDFFIFVGLFTSDIPTMQPVTCALREGFGRVRMRRPPPGRYRAFAVAIPTDADEEDVILQDCSLRGSARDVVVDRGNSPLSVRIVLRPPDLLSAPLLPIFPLVLQNHVGARMR